MTSFFNFRSEVLYKFDELTYDLFMDAFDILPIACLLNNRFLALHGGISPDLVTIDDIDKISRIDEPPKSGIFCDILWSDPVEDEGGVCEPKFKENEVRGCSFFFG